MEEEMITEKTILIVDDEKPIVDILVYNLEKEGYKTIEANDGISAVNIALEQRPDLILLDIMLPKLDGLTVCKKIKNALNVPILMLTAKDSEIDKILGLELGADDYITKPFSVRELVARVKANLRKVDAGKGIDIITTKVIEKNKINEKENNIVKKINSQNKKELNNNNNNKENKIVVGELEINLDKFEVKVRDDIIELTLREFEVIRFLATQPEQVVTRETLLEKVWGYEYYGDIRTVDVTVRRIREKIEVDTSEPKILITKRGIGYYISSTYLG